MDTMSVPSVPTALSVTGLYDVDYRVVVVCRNGVVCVLKRGWILAKTLAIMDSQVSWAGGSLYSVIEVLTRMVDKWYNEVLK